jgi:hypothetical protein
MHSGVAQNAGSQIEGVSLRDPAQVEQHPGVDQGDGAPPGVEPDRAHACRAGGDVEGAAGGAPDRDRAFEELERVEVERNRGAAGYSREVRNEALGKEPGEPRVTIFDCLNRRLRGTAMPLGLDIIDDQLEPRAHGGGGEPHSFLTFIFAGSNPKADPSHIERVARSTITITFAPSSTGLGTGSRVRMHSIHRRRR